VSTNEFSRKTIINKIILSIVSISLICISPFSHTQANEADSIFQFLTISPSPSAHALGNSSLTRDSRAYSIYYNPALPSFYKLPPRSFIYSADTYTDPSQSPQEKIHSSVRELPAPPLIKTINFSLSYARYFQSLNFGSVFGTFQFQKYGTFGIGFISLFYDDINRYDQDSSGNYISLDNNINAGNYCIILNYSYKISEKISIGINFKVIREILDDAGNTFFNNDIGWIYKNPGWGIGLVFHNIGLPVKQDSVEYDQPLDIEAGGHYNIKIKKLLIDPRDMIILTMKLKKGIEAEYIIGGGIEYQWTKRIFIRTGYQYKGNDDGLKAGLGFRYKNLRLDYALSFYGNLGSTHRIGLSMSLENRDYQITQNKNNKVFKKSRRGMEVSIQSDLLFEYNSNQLKYEAVEILNKVIRIIKSLKNYLVRIEGNTDSTGLDSYNNKLSKMRAQSVYNYMVKNGIDKKRLIAISLGERNPIFSNETEEGRRMNRRVDVILIEKKDKKSIQEMINELPHAERMVIEELYYFGLDMYYKDDLKGALDLWKKIKTSNKELQKKIKQKIKMVTESAVNH